MEFNLPTVPRSATCSSTAKLTCMDQLIHSELILLMKFQLAVLTARWTPSAGYLQIPLGPPIYMTNNVPRLHMEGQLAHNS